MSLNDKRMQRACLYQAICWSVGRRREGKKQGDIMKTRELERIEEKLCRIQEKPFVEQKQLLIDLQREIKLALPYQDDSVQREVRYRTQGIHTFLQSKMMINACVSAKRSCFWAAVAAIAACIGVLLTLCCK